MLTVLHILLKSQLNCINIYLVSRKRVTYLTFSLNDILHSDTPFTTISTAKLLIIYMMDPSFR
jgi:hypothetical protein